MTEEELNEIALQLRLDLENMIEKQGLWQDLERYGKEKYRDRKKGRKKA